MFLKLLALLIVLIMLGAVGSLAMLARLPTEKSTVPDIIIDISKENGGAAGAILHGGAFTVFDQPKWIQIIMSDKLRYESKRVRGFHVRVEPTGPDGAPELWLVAVNEEPLPFDEAVQRVRSISEAWGIDHEEIINMWLTEIEEGRIKPLGLGKRLPVDEIVDIGISLVPTWNKRRWTLLFRLDWKNAELSEKRRRELEAHYQRIIEEERKKE